MIDLRKRHFSDYKVSPHFRLRILEAQLWRARVEDAAPFNALLFRYPTLLMYSFGAAARLEYFCYVNERKPDASEARQLLMLPRKAVEAWGDHDGCVSDSTPAILGGIVTKRGRPCLGESAADAFDRRAVRRAAQPCAPQQFGEMNVHELRILLRKNGGTPSVKRKAQLISELKTLGCSPDKEQDIHRENTAQANDASGNSQISYRQWMAIKLCYAYPEFLGVYDTSVTRGRSSFAGDEGERPHSDTCNIFVPEYSQSALFVFQELLVVQAV